MINKKFDKYEIAGMIIIPAVYIILIILVSDPEGTIYNNIEHMGLFAIPLLPFIYLAMLVLAITLITGSVLIMRISLILFSIWVGYILGSIIKGIVGWLNRPKILN